MTTTVETKPSSKSVKLSVLDISMIEEALRDYHPPGYSRRQINARAALIEKLSFTRSGRLYY